MSANGSPEMNESMDESDCGEDFVEVEYPEDRLTSEELAKVSALIGNELPEDCHIKQLLGYFTQNTYTASEVDPRVQIALDTCMEYIQRDYKVVKVNNQNGILSTCYPAIIPYLEGERDDNDTICEATISTNDLNELLRKAYRARCRQRFPVPVIMYKERCICRSATLAGSAEIYGRMTLDMIRPGNVPQGDGSLDEMIAAQVSDDETGWKAISELQIADIALLKRLKVSTIVDLMVENRKSKLGVPVTSSEKVDKDNKYHSNFNLLSLPFPGCEFFKEFHDRNYIAEGLYFNWNQPMCDAELSVPPYPALDYLNIDWKDYKNWDLVKMTQNYIKYILKYFEDNDSGILIHCISGWDRTPLFISLLRMSLWADGLIHKSLNVKEMLFFTLAYDWMLFGHHLTDRLSKNEDILLFCFTVLKHLVDDEYSLVDPSLLMKSPESGTDSSPSYDDSDTTYADKDRDEHMFSPETSPRPSSLSPVGRGSPQINYPIEFDIPVPAPLSPPVTLSTLGDFDFVIPMDNSENSYCEELDFYNCRQPPPPADGPSRDNDESGSHASWEVVSATGSVRGFDNDTQGFGDCSSRKGRLTQLRRLFYRCYYQTLTEKHVNYSNTTITVMRGILHNLNEMTGNLTREKQEQ